MTEPDITSIWPLFGLRVGTPRVELRPPREADFFALATLATKGVHDPDFMPFYVPWTDAPSPVLERGSLQFFWRTYATFTVESWRLPFAVWVDGQIVGLQDVAADDFPTLRTVNTGSWLGREFQGRGIGKEMRSAVLHFAFDGLGATRAETGAFVGNDSSLGVTRALGYEPNGDAIHRQRTERGAELKFKMERAGFDKIRRDDVVVEGLDACLSLFGLDERASRA